VNRNNNLAGELVWKYTYVTSRPRGVKAFLANEDSAFHMFALPLLCNTPEQHDQPEMNTVSKHYTKLFQAISTLCHFTARGSTTMFTPALSLAESLSKCQLPQGVPANSAQQWMW